MLQWDDTRVRRQTSSICFRFGGHDSEDFSLLVSFLLVAFPWLFCGPCLPQKTFFVAFPWLFRSPCALAEARR